jgi:hypothetical protein
MGLTIGELVARAEVGSVVLRGKACAVRALTAAQTARIHGLHVRPQPPWAPDMTRGSKAPAIMDERDPEYQHKLAAYVERLGLLHAAAALDLAVTVEGPLGPTVYAFSEAWADAGLLRKWCDAAEKELGAALTDGEVRRVVEASKKITDADAVGEALKNSPPPPENGPTAG